VKGVHVSERTVQDEMVLRTAKVPSIPSFVSTDHFDHFVHHCPASSSSNVISTSKFYMLPFLMLIVLIEFS